MIQDRRHKAHDVAEAMYSARQERYDERRCPKKYCAREIEAKAKHPEL